MEYHIFIVEWSQTDKDKYIIIADSKAQAVSLANDKFQPGTRRGAEYVQYFGMVPQDRVIQFK
jgi:hypothetical protein